MFTTSICTGNLNGLNDLNALVGESLMVSY
jgi:hypothetical protein